jgi:hypothetical protein
LIKSKSKLKIDLKLMKAIYKEKFGFSTRAQKIFSKE